MVQRLRLFAGNIGDKWNELDRMRKIKLIITVSALIVALAAVIGFTARPKNAEIYNNLDYATGGEYQTILNEAGIRSKLKDGRLTVREADVDKAYYQITVNGPESYGTTKQGVDSTFKDALDLMNMGTTESVKREILLNNKQDQIANGLRMFVGVQDAKVTLTVPAEDRYFLKGDQKASAAVIIYTIKDFTQEKKAVENMARYICNSIKGLTMDDIEITDQNAALLYSGMAPKDDQEGNIALQELERRKKTDLESKVKSYVLPLYDEANIISNIELNNDKVFEELRNYENPYAADSQTGFLDTEVNNKSSASGGVQDGEVGMGANDQTAPDYQMSTGNAYNAKKSENQTKYLYDEVYSRIEHAQGVVDYNNSSLSLMLYRHQVYNQADFENGVYAAQAEGIEIGRSSRQKALAWQQFKERNKDNVLIAADEPGVVQLRDNISTGTHFPLENVSIIACNRPVFIDRVEESQLQHYIILAILAALILLLLYGFIKKTQPEEVPDAEQELSVEDVLISSQIEEEKEAEIADQLGDIAYNADSETKLQIEKFIEERPEAVAQLLRNWLNEDWE
ncbi:MAG: hypothetical protein LBU36_03665 [Clostridiales bacterium]|jgi:flagellar M-ring protein FliF|nr:hypothetical protein [Clostridiales bacterium]